MRNKTKGRRVGDDPMPDSIIMLLSGGSVVFSAVPVKYPYVGKMSEIYMNEVDVGNQ